MKNNKFSRLLLSLPLVLIIALVGCAQQAATPEPTQVSAPTEAESAERATAAVSVVDSEFQPAEITITPGTTVTWTNEGSLRHTVTDDGGMFDSGSLSSGETFEFTFEESGTYPYHCTFHGGPGGVGMSGVITVE